MSEVLSPSHDRAGFHWRGTEDCRAPQAYSRGSGHGTPGELVIQFLSSDPILLSSDPASFSKCPPSTHAHPRGKGCGISGEINTGRRLQIKRCLDKIILGVNHAQPGSRSCAASQSFVESIPCIPFAAFSFKQSSEEMALVEMIQGSKAFAQGVACMCSGHLKASLHRQHLSMELPQKIAPLTISCRCQRSQHGA